MDDEDKRDLWPRHTVSNTSHLEESKDILVGHQADSVSYED